MRLARLAMACLIATVMTMSGAAVVFAVPPPPPPSCDPTGCTILPWPGSEANQPEYWEAYFADKDYDCTKVDQRKGVVITHVDHAALIIKSGQFNYIWEPAPAGSYTTSQGFSHWFYCDGPADPDIVAPAGSIIGPCADPSYAGVFDNTASTVPLTFVFRWMTTTGIHKAYRDVPPGGTYTTWLHWAKPGTLIYVSYISPNGLQHKILATQLSESGSYPPCEITPGFS